MKAVAEIAVSFAPMVLAGVYPFIQLLRGGRALSSFFLCWVLVVFWTFIFAFAPAVVALVSIGVSHDLDSWMPEGPAVVAMTFFGWFPSAITILLGLLTRLFVKCLRQGMNSKNAGDFVKGVVLLLILTMVGAAWHYVTPVAHAPSDGDLLQRFYTHRSAFEQIRDILQSGQTGTSDHYLSLIKEVGALDGIRREGTHPEIDILLWTQGFGGDSVHVGVCWDETVPSRQVENLDVYYRDHKSSGATGLVYQHIDGNWYLFTDIATD